MKPGAIAKTIGKALLDLRRDRELRQDDVARAARQVGLPWTRAVVRSLELGRRALTIDEWAQLPRMLRRLGVEVVAPDPGKHPAEISVDKNDLVRFHIGSIVPEKRQDLGTRWEPSLAVMRRNEQVLRAAWPNATRKDLEAAYEGAGADLEQKVGRRFRLDPLAIALAARATWGRSLTDERDRRIVEGATAGTAPRAIQALRGHITRALLAELEPRLTGARKRLRRKGAPR